jgi:hypothetical protein
VEAKEETGTMPLSRRLFRVWVILAGLWVAYLGCHVAYFVVSPIQGYSLAIEDRTIIALQWAAHWALIPPVALLLAGWLFWWIGHLFLLALRVGSGKWRAS